MGRLHILPVSYGLHESALWKSADCPSWSNTLAAEISGPNPNSFMKESYESDGVQNQSTDEYGTLRSNYECCCLDTRTPRTDATGSKLLFESSKAVHWKLR
jgi:hypothetical protein